MKDSKDKKTVDAFKRGRGRPVTSTPEKKAADNAERQRKFRIKKKAENALFKAVLAGDDFAKELAKVSQEKTPEGYCTYIVYAIEEGHWQKYKAEFDHFMELVIAPGLPFFDAKIETERLHTW